MIKPSIFTFLLKSKVNRKKIGLVFGGATFVLFFLIALNPPPKDAYKDTPQEAVTPVNETKVVTPTLIPTSIPTKTPEPTKPMSIDQKITDTLKAKT